MNHIYRIIFNRSLGIYQCVCEFAKAQGKSSGKIFKVSVLATAVATSGVAVADDFFSDANSTFIDANVNGNQTYNKPYIVIASKPSDDVTIRLNKGETFKHTSVGTEYEQSGGGAEPERIPHAVLIGQRGKATVNANGAIIDIADTLILGESSNSDGNNSSGEITLYSSGNLNVGNLIGVGYNGKGQINLYDSKINTQDIILSSADHYGQSQQAITGSISASNNSSITANNSVVIGQTGKGEVVLNGGGILKTKTLKVGGKRQEVDDGQSGQSTIYGSGDLQAQNNSSINAEQVFVGEQGYGLVFLYDNSHLNADKIFVGGNGDGVLKTKDDFNARLILEKNSSITTGYLGRGNKAGDYGTASLVDLSGGKIITAQDTILFDGFRPSDTISMGISGAIFDTNDYNVSIAPTARLSGGSKYYPESNSGGFQKVGKGTLNVSGKTFSDVRSDIIVGGGTLSIDGDYAIRDYQTLYVALTNEKDYGKLHASGRSISHKAN